MKIALARSKEEIAACYPVVKQLRPHLSAETFMAAVQRMTDEGYRLVYLEDTHVRSVAGFRKMEMLATGFVLYVDDLVTAAEDRSKGYGAQLLAWLREEAKRLGCQYLELDSGLKRVEAHRFYQKNGMEKVAFHFSIPAAAAKGWAITEVQG